VKEFAATESHRASRALATAAQVVATDPEASASRAYYAAFHAVTALFALRGQSFTKHAALRAAVHRDLVKPGTWSVELGKDFDTLVFLRETGDYGGLTQLTEADAQKAVAAARRILEACQQLCPNLGHLAQGPQ
jgi:uncharacterized protein (UPF0332 family)